MVVERDENDRLTEIAQRLVDFIRPLHSCAVAFSGGVDSAVVARAAHLALNTRSLAVTGVSPSLAQGELENARRVAKQIGIRHRIIETTETELDDYRRNDARRCFHCKSNLYSEVSRLSTEEGFQFILSGANQDDLSDHRPGLVAAQSHGVRHPLAECHIDKASVRALARWWSLDVWDKPATPCLASRIAYGVEVTEKRMQQIDAAEQFLRSLGFEAVRVRLHGDELARIELAPNQISRLAEESERKAIVDRFRKLGFRFISLDLIGFRSGSLNEILQIEAADPYDASKPVGEMEGTERHEKPNTGVDPAANTNQSNRKRHSSG